MARLGPVKAFRALRLLARLTIRVPEDLPAVRRALGGEVADALTVGPDSCIEFPRFDEVREAAQRVKCFMMCRRLRDWGAVADAMGWSPDQVRRAYKAVSARAKALEEVL